MTKTDRTDLIQKLRNMEDVEVTELEAENCYSVYSPHGAMEFEQSGYNNEYSFKVLGTYAEKRGVKVDIEVIQE